MKAILTVSVMAALGLPLAAQVQGARMPVTKPADDVVEGPNVRVRHYEDRSKSIFTRSADRKEITKKTLNAGGRLVLVTRYWLDDLGNPRAAKVYDGQNTELFKIDYGYRKADGLLALERMFDSRVRRVWKDRPDQEMPVQVTHWVDAEGRAIYPMTVSYVAGKTFEEVYGSKTTRLPEKLFDDKGANGNSKKPQPKP